MVELSDGLNQLGYRTKTQNRTSGLHKGGCIFRRGTLYHLLANPIYRGKIVHKGEIFDGEHDDIVSFEMGRCKSDAACQCQWQLVAIEGC